MPLIHKNYAISVREPCIILVVKAPNGNMYTRLRPEFHKHSEASFTWSSYNTVKVNKCRVMVAQLRVAILSVLKACNPQQYGTLGCQLARQVCSGVTVRGLRTDRLTDCRVCRLHSCCRLTDGHTLVYMLLNCHYMQYNDYTLIRESSAALRAGFVKQLDYQPA